LSVIRATTSLPIGLSVIVELIIGYVLPSRPIAMMLFKTWGSMAVERATTFMGFFKLAHYMKIAHRPMFVCQIIATIVASAVQLGVQAWMFSNIEGLCDADQKDGFICPHTTAFGNASIIVSKLVVLAHIFCIRWLKDVVLQWGVIGPRRLLSHGQLYYGLVFFFLAGILAPLFQWILHKKFRIGSLKYINFPVAFGNTAYMLPATPLNYMLFVFVCFIFNYIIRRRHFDWWAKYNCESLLDEAIRWVYFFLTRLVLGVGYFSCVGRWLGCRLLSRCPHRLLCFAIPEKWHDWSGRHSEMVG
jgi:OPT oligopeptide transporter protein